MPPAASTATSLKKGEGEPLNRHDVQYALLEKIFNDETAVFSPRPGSDYDLPDEDDNFLTFNELYVEDFLCSNKLSRTLRDKFVNDPEVTKKVCMACLLVNTGRINTTLVFTPTQARTYNPIPAIQAYGSGHKMLQDAPRLKGILKGSCDTAPVDWEAMRAAQKAGAKKPILNPIQLIFLFSSPNTTIDVTHFKDYAFLPHELLSDTRYTSDSRAKAWLWLMYHYIETNGTAEDAQKNPFGPSPGELLVPTLVPAEEGESYAENIDLPAEVEYSTKMWEERKRYLALSAQKAIESTPTATTSTTAAATAATTNQSKETPSKADTKERADSLTPSLADAENVRRSSRKVKRKTYESGLDLDSPREDGTGATAGSDEHQQQQQTDSYRTQRCAQILRHTLARSRHRSRKQRHAVSAIVRAHALAKDAVDEAWQWGRDRDAEEVQTIAKLIRRAERRGQRPANEQPEQARRLDERKKSGNFKIKLKF